MLTRSEESERGWRYACLAATGGRCCLTSASRRQKGERRVVLPTFGGATQPHLVFAGLGQATAGRVYWIITHFKIVMQTCLASQLVTFTIDRADIPGVFGIGLDFAAQVPYVYVDGAVHTLIVVPKGPVH